MFFLINKKRKIIFGTTQKCGCTFIKNLFRYICKMKSNEHVENYFFDHIYDLKNFKIVIFLRDIYDRVVSVFMDKYNHVKNPNYIKTYPWTNKKKLTFKNIVLELEKSFKNDKWTVDFKHFQKQIGNEFKEDKLEIFKMNNSIDVMYIDNINWEYLESIFDIKIDESVINFKTSHINNNICKDSLNTRKLYDLTHQELQDLKYNYDDFYNEELNNIIYNIYSKDNSDFFK